MTAADIRLPDPAARMTPLRKLDLLTALRRGQITRAFVLRRYRISDEELSAWQAAYAQRGLRGLSVTKLQEVGRRG